MIVRLSYTAVATWCQVLLTQVRRILELRLLDLELMVDQNRCGNTPISRRLGHGLRVVHHAHALLRVPNRHQLLLLLLLLAH